MEGTEEKGILQKLMLVQLKLKVEKGSYNEFGKFYSRSKEDILEAVKPLAHEQGCIVLVEDEIVEIPCGWVYVRAKASLIDVNTQAEFSAIGWAREPKDKPKMDWSQVTGSAASYAGKRALGNLFAIDDTADADQLPPKNEMAKDFTVRCKTCGAELVMPDWEIYQGFLNSPDSNCCEKPNWGVV